ncbi:hypothetical protein P8A18_19510 [Streptomyces castrisilvae]|uniref:Uncharacterized protein n=1 Tax=Streptomyces castrisilvae TaxID=3033811 RepID=A0ABY9HN79_9ACTN|nr:hypothetical protein [Streptomyces sp. Mut1]WLQ35473.1 hypothetical protein P8A18_19510 [Streptomyces sp. Mut1]
MSLSHIVLSSGRSVELTEVRMSSTYAWMLEGYPCKPVNDMKLRGLRSQAEQAYPGTPCHLVPPRPEYPDRSTDAARPFGPVEVLPPVTCIGLLRSTAVAPGLDPALHRSALAVAWLQGTLDVPSGEDAEPALRELHWDELARDYEL